MYVQDCSSRRTTIAFVKGLSVTQKLFLVVQKTFSNASCMCVEGLMKQEKVQGYVNQKPETVTLLPSGLVYLLLCFLSKVSTHYLLRLFYVCLLLKRKNCCPWKISALPFLHTIYSDGDRLWLLTGVILSPLINVWPTLIKLFAQWTSTER